MQQSGRDDNAVEQVPGKVEGSGQSPESAPTMRQRRKKVVGCLLPVYALQLMLFGLLAWSVHINPILSLDVAVARSLQQNQSPWLLGMMLVISYPGSSFLLPTLIVLTTEFFWAMGFRLEAVWVAGLSTVSPLLNLLVKVQASRPRPAGNLVKVIQTAVGFSFPSGKEGFKCYHVRPMLPAGSHQARRLLRSLPAAPVRGD